MSATEYWATRAAILSHASVETLQELDALGVEWPISGDTIKVGVKAA